MTHVETGPALPAELDQSRPSVARVYDAFLGGKDNYEVDREVCRRAVEIDPDAARVPRDGRDWLMRVVRFLVEEAGIDQILDCGSGLPTAENTHQIVQRIAKDTNVVYIDNDPVVLAHGRALLAETDFTHMVEADIFTPQEVLGNQEVLRHIDFAEPVGLLQVGTMHHLEGDGVVDIMREYVDALPSGSYVVLSHFFDPEVPELTEIAKRIEQILVQGPLGAGRFRTRAEIEAMMAGLELVQPNATSEPGLAICDEWWPDGPRLTPLSDAAKCVAGIVGRKP
jgi:hypothetical protein